MSGSLSVTAAQTASNNFVSAVQDMIEQLRLAANDPSDAIRILTSLANFDAIALTQAQVSLTDPASPGIGEATASMCRRAVLTSLARAVASYSPTSSGDGQDILNAITPLYDAEILYAGNVGDDVSYQQLRALRTAVVTDLQVRASQLPQLITITRNIALPSLVVAWQQYNDASRYTQIETRLDPACGLFMPLSMTILNS